MSLFSRIIMFIHLGLGVLLFVCCAQAQIKSEEIVKILKANGINTSDVTMEVRQDNKVVFGLNEKVLMIPASVTKIFTAYAVLKQIPFNYKFKTEMFFDDKNIYVKGGGDPGFVSENMWYLVNEFKRQGISHIPGDIILDDSLFDQIRYDESRESKRIDRSYDAPVGALSFNWNSVNVYVKPENGKVQAYVDPESNYFTLRNTAKISKRPKDLILSIDQNAQMLTLSGELSSQVPEKAYFKNVSDPIKWFGENLKSFLNQRGVSIKGKIKAGKVPSSARSVAVVESKPLTSVLADMNKFSNNFVAEMLTKNLSAYSGESPAKLSTGVSLIKSELKKLNITDKDMLLLNPSGFSRDNRFSAHALTEVLSHIQTDFKIYPSFVDSLPLSGFDGTLKKRMKDTPTEGYVRAKTGYLDGVVSLAGYVAKRPDAGSDVYAFTFIYNGAKDEAAVRATFDKVLNYIVN
jgi:serine-type D-Ala-D-Ala carboxypeptidase/endopeptidase (penicillin-binding protein 4)